MFNQVTSPSLISDVGGMPHITTPSYAKEFRKVIESAAKGRQTFTVQVNSVNIDKFFIDYYYYLFAFLYTFC